MSIKLRIVLILSIVIGFAALYKEYKNGNKTNATMICDGILVPIEVQFLGTENSGSYAVKLIGADGTSQILHVPADKCLIVEDQK